MAIANSFEGETIHIASQVLVQKYDQLRERGFGEHLSLPQIVVVGNQSSGKSSLLESLTGLPFDRDTRLCTRHATQITSRRDTERRIVVSIIPDPGAAEAHKAHVAQFKQTIPPGSDLRGELGRIGENARTAMGIAPNEGKAFSNDILKIEIVGPNEDYLTVIDVPGIFENTTKGITTEADKILVKNMVESYIKDSRTIILAVLPSGVDITTQGILSLAQKYDKTGERTIGVLTKADLLKQQADIDNISELVLGKRQELTLGYHVVINRGADGHDSSDSSVRDRIFREPPWNTLPQDRLGVAALRARLGDLLHQIAKQEFPKVRKEASALLQSTQQELLNLGVSRRTEQEQRIYLTTVTSQFQEIARAAIRGQYSSHAAFEDGDNLRLITRLLSLGDRFKSEFEKWSEVRCFNDEQPSNMPDGERLNDMMRFMNDEHDTDVFPDLSDQVGNSGSDEIKRPVGDIMPWIESLYLRSRGPELGTFGGTIVSSAFKEQSSKWRQMTTIYITKAIVIIHQFIEGALRVSCPDARVREDIWSAISDDIGRTYRAGMRKAMELVDTEREDDPYTFNSSFSELVEKARTEREARRSASRRQIEAKFGVSSPAFRRNNISQIKDDIHDILFAYYRIARDRLIDNLYRQVITHSLLRGEKSPLNALNQEWVINLNADHLESLAGEVPSSKAYRTKLERKQAGLKEALQILRL